MLDSYGENGEPTVDFSHVSDATKLRLLADWFDQQDAIHGVTEHEVQDDLRRIADELDYLDCYEEDDEGYTEMIFWVVMTLLFIFLIIII